MSALTHFVSGMEQDRSDLSQSIRQQSSRLMVTSHRVVKHPFWLASGLNMTSMPMFAMYRVKVEQIILFMKIANQSF